MRACLKKHGAPEDIFQCVEKPSIPLAQELMAICDLTIATGGSAMVKAAYSSGKPAYGVGAGNATMVIDETADIEEAARNTRLARRRTTGRAARPTAICWWTRRSTIGSWSSCSASTATW